MLLLFVLAYMELGWAILGNCIFRSQLLNDKYVCALSVNLFFRNQGAYDSLIFDLTEVELSSIIAQCNLSLDAEKPTKEYGESIIEYVKQNCVCMLFPQVTL